MNYSDEIDLLSNHVEGYELGGFVKHRDFEGQHHEKYKHEK